MPGVMGPVADPAGGIGPAGGMAVAASPRSGARLVAHVVLEGRDRAITRMELVETDGDRTTTSFEDVEIDVVLDDVLFERSGADGATPAEPR